MNGSRVVVVTGGTSGVGRATARAFAAAGDRVAVVARGRDGLEATQSEARARGQVVLGAQADVADSEAVEAAAREIESTLGPPDVWVNGAMATVSARSQEISPEEFVRATAGPTPSAQTAIAARERSFEVTVLAHASTSVSDDDAALHYLERIAGCHVTSARRGGRRERRRARPAADGSPASRAATQPSLVLRRDGRQGVARTTSPAGARVGRATRTSVRSCSLRRLLVPFASTRGTGSDRG